LQVELEKAIKRFYEWNIENQLTNLVSEAKDWVTYFEESKVFDNLKNIIEGSKKNLLSAKKIFGDECNKKKANSNYDINFSQLEQIEELWKSVANEVKRFNDSIKEFCDEFESKNRDDFTSDLGKLSAAKDRQEKDWTEFCEEYKALIKGLEKLKQKRDAKIDELTNYSTDVFNKHEETINSILENIGVDFKIDNFKGKDDRRRTDAVSCGFDIKFFGQHSVPIEGQENTPHFNNTLSQGDRGSLAFAFFLSLLFHDNNLDRKVIVFDDPVSSFDAERKRKTVQMLADIENANEKKPLQMIILTHEINFLSRLVREQKFANAITYKLEPDGIINGQKNCTMRRCNINEEFLKKETYRYLEEIKNAADGNLVISDAQYLKCRKVMEAVFKAKYYLELKGDIGQNKGLRQFVETLTGLGIYSYDKKSEFTGLFNDLHVPHHDRNVPEGISDNSQGDLRSILQDTLRLLRKI
jgi:wobble nucleotide-excising tRNase